jgi:hypothetical protein
MNLSILARIYSYSFNVIFLKKYITLLILDTVPCKKDTIYVFFCALYSKLREFFKNKMSIKVLKEHLEQLQNGFSEVQA